MKAGFLDRIRLRLAPTPREAVASALFIAALAFAGYAAFRYVVVEAVWSGDPEACRRAAGACWPFLAERWRAIVFGFVPAPLTWLVSAASLLVVAAAVLGRVGRRPAPSRRLAAVLFGCAAMLVVAAIVLGRGDPTAQLGGLLLTLAVAGFAIVAGLPLGLGLALMRTSNMPVLRGLATVWIEVWRGIPTVVARFFAIAVFPLLVPREVDLSKLLRALLAFTCLTSALFAEAFRGGLQVVGAGQREAAWSLGLGPVQTLRWVTLPQALAIATPNIVNVCVALIKETTLVLIIGLYDVFGVIQTGILEPKWSGGSATTTGYAIAAVGFCVVCGGLSALARRFETRLGR